MKGGVSSINKSANTLPAVETDNEERSNVNVRSAGDEKATVGYRKDISNDVTQ